MKILKYNGVFIIGLICIIFSLPKIASSSESVLNTLKIEKNSKKQNKMLQDMMKLHTSLTSIDPFDITKQILPNQPEKDLNSSKSLNEDKSTELNNQIKLNSQM